MRAMILNEKASGHLELADLPRADLKSGEVRIKVHACGVCRTDLHVVDGELEHPKMPIVPGHEIVGTVIEVGHDVQGLLIGTRVGVPWLGFSYSRKSVV